MARLAEREEQVKNKGRSFQGAMGGANYDRWTDWFGMGPAFYRKAVFGLTLGRNVRILDLGCGTGSLSVALAERTCGGAKIFGVDISEDQLSRARQKTVTMPGQFEFVNCSMDELVYSDDCFDVVATSMALHETPCDVRRGAIREVARVLKPKGLFLLVDWSKPRWGLMAALWLPFLFFGEWRDNWNNTYYSVCEDSGLQRTDDSYISSLIRRQVFVKRG
jgi:demethylmenaquinone methyltransferase/2-methoxy-6-polyprenyl-1,4-benzoquinol methylase